MVFQHITEFLDIVNSGEDTVVFGMIFDTQKTKFCKYQLLFFEISLPYFFFSGLGFYSEQAFESMHADIKVRY